MTIDQNTKAVDVPSEVLPVILELKRLWNKAYRVHLETGEHSSDELDMYHYELDAAIRRFPEYRIQLEGRIGF